MDFYRGVCFESEGSEKESFCHRRLALTPEISALTFQKMAWNYERVKAQFFVIFLLCQKSCKHEETFPS